MNISKKTKKIINFPTILTLLRIILVIPIAALLLVHGSTCSLIALILFIISALSDTFDGLIARKYNIVTNLGKFLDPLADKMLVNITFLVLVFRFEAPLWMFIVILIRDFAVDGLRMTLSSKGEVLAASIFGKAKTWAQMFTIALIIFNLVICSTTIAIIGDILLYISVILTIISGADYLIRGWKKVIE